MHNFLSYYWNPEELDDTSLIDAFRRLSTEDSTTEEKLRSFRVLLDSESITAQGIAFDYFFYKESLFRYGEEHRLYLYKEELINKARNQLSGRAVTSVNSTGKRVDGANYASAFGVLTHLGEEQDLELIGSVFQTASDSEVLFSGCLALKRSLGMTKKNYSVILSRLSQIIYDNSLPEELRVVAIGALADYEIAGVEELLVEVSQECDLPFSAYAAEILGSRNLTRYRNLLQELADRWPEGARYPASAVRELLEGNATDVEPT
jgi:hypothetical protein